VRHFGTALILDVLIFKNIFCHPDLKQAFRLFDKEERGVVTTQEIGSVLRNLGLFPTEQELQQMLKDIDIDGDGTFSFDGSWLRFFHLIMSFNLF
jgi:hypothetical protein